MVLWSHWFQQICLAVSRNELFCKGMHQNGHPSLKAWERRTISWQPSVTSRWPSAPQVWEVLESLSWPACRSYNAIVLPLNSWPWCPTCPSQKPQSAPQSLVGRIAWFEINFCLQRLSTSEAAFSFSEPLRKFEASSPPESLNGCENARQNGIHLVGKHLVFIFLSTWEATWCTDQGNGEERVTVQY